MITNKVQTRPYFKIFICRIFWRSVTILSFLCHMRYYRIIITDYYNDTNISSVVIARIKAQNYHSNEFVQFV